MRSPILPVLALVTAGCGWLSGVMAPHETELERAVKAHDVEAVWTYLAVTPQADAASVACSVNDLARQHLSASDPRTAEILEMIEARNPQCDKRSRPP